MLSEEERKVVQGEIAAKEKELEALKTELQRLHDIKEKLFAKKREATDKLNASSKTAREAKGKRNSFTKQVKDSKQRRDELNQQIKEKVAVLKKLQEEKDRVKKQFGYRMDPAKIKAEIEEIEFKIETEALPFSAEQRLMKQVGEKKKLLAQISEQSGVFGDVHEIQKELKKLRKKADEAHKKIQTKAEESQSHHEELIEASKEIKDLRDTEDATLKEFLEAKKEYNDQNDKVKAKLDEIKALKVKIGEVVKEEKAKERKVEQEKIAETKRDVEEKIKKGQKLTTEDLLVFQAESNKK